MRLRVKCNVLGKFGVGTLGFVLSLCLFTGAFSPLAGQETLEEDNTTHGQLASLRLGDVSTPYNVSTVSVPVFVKNHYFADGLHLTIDYDQVFLGYAWYRVADDNWRVERVSPYGDSRVTIVLRKNSRTGAQDMNAGQDEVLALYAVFYLKAVSPEGEPFRLRTSLSIGNDLDPSQKDMSYFFVLGSGEAYRPIATQTHSGSATIYFHDGVEAGWGAITKTEQEFTLPLYLTYLRNDRNTFSVGVDYDELFLSLVDVRGLSPPLEDKDFEVSSSQIGPHMVRAAFDLSLSSATTGPMSKVYVADLHFHYNGREPPDDRLQIEPKLLLQGAPVNDGQDAGGQNVPKNDGGGASYGENVPGVVKLLPAYFVRGNADSSVKYLQDGTLSVRGDLTDAFMILKAIFLGHSEIACEDAADVNNNGTVEISDAISLLNHFWRSGPPPLAPYPNPGVDSDTDDALNCAKPLPYFRPLDEGDDK